MNVIPQFQARLRHVALCAAAVLAGPTGAAISVNATDPANATGNNSEFFLVIWDPVREVSYVKDLGLRLPTLLGTGQSDDGFQQFWSLDVNTDPKFKKLRDLGTAVDQLLWGIYALDAEGDAFTPGSLNLYTTLNHATPTGTLNPMYSRLLTIDDLSFAAYLSAIPTAFIDPLNTNTSNPDNGHPPGITAGDFAANGSSYTAKGQPEYWGQTDSTGAWLPNLGAAFVSLMNPVGKSSWFYRVTPTADGNPFAPVLVSEFENQTHDAYWGLALNTNDNTFALSYTLNGTALPAAMREFALSIGRTEANRGYAVTRLEGIAASNSESAAGFANRLLGSADEEFGRVTSPVPEPGTWALMGAGLLWLARRSRKHHHDHCA